MKKRKLALSKETVKALTDHGPALVNGGARTENCDSNYYSCTGAMSDCVK